MSDKVSLSMSIYLSPRSTDDDRVMAIRAMTISRKWRDLMNVLVMRSLDEHIEEQILYALIDQIKTGNEVVISTLNGYNQSGQLSVLSFKTLSPYLSLMDFSGA